MTLYQMSFVYREDALRFRMRITALREQAKAAPTRDERERFKRRILELQQLQRQSHELAELTRHYYERGYWRSENTPYKIRNNEIYGDLTAWLTAHAGDNESDLMRLKRNLRLAREEELTPRQRELLRLRYEENMTVSEIAAAIGRDKSTVSRTLSRARRRLYKCLRYGL